LVGEILSADVETKNYYVSDVGAVRGSLDPTKE
jgi:hypothetical protein